MWVVVGGWFPGRNREGNLGVFGEPSVLVLQLAAQFHWSLFPTGLVPSPRNGNSGSRLKGGWGGDDPRRGGEFKGGQVGGNSI